MIIYGSPTTGKSEYVIKLTGSCSSGEEKGFVTIDVDHHEFKLYDTDWLLPLAFYNPQMKPISTIPSERLKLAWIVEAARHFKNQYQTTANKHWQQLEEAVIAFCLRITSSEDVVIITNLHMPSDYIFTRKKNEMSEFYRERELKKMQDKSAYIEPLWIKSYSTSKIEKLSPEAKVVLLGGDEEYEFISQFDPIRDSLRLKVSAPKSSSLTESKPFVLNSLFEKHKEEL